MFSFSLLIASADSLKLLQIHLYHSSETCGSPFLAREQIWGTCLQHGSGINQNWEGTGSCLQNLFLWASCIYGKKWKKLWELNILFKTTFIQLKLTFEKYEFRGCSHMTNLMKEDKMGHRYHTIMNGICDGRCGDTSLGRWKGAPSGLKTPGMGAGRQILVLDLLHGTRKPSFTPLLQWGTLQRETAKNTKLRLQRQLVEG